MGIPQSFFPWIISDKVLHISKQIQSYSEMKYDSGLESLLGEINY